MNDRELDLRIARDVLQLLVDLVPKAWTFDDWLSSDTPSACNVMAIVNTSFTAGGMEPPAYIVPSYSADIAEAWKVADKLADETGCQVQLIRNFAWQSPRYTAFVRGGDLAYPNARLEVMDSDANPVRALCLALLKVRRLTAEEKAAIEDASP
jgi:hypothetical protein